MNYLIAALVLAAAGFGAGWTANGWRLGQEVQSLKTEHEKTIGDAEKAAKEQLASLVTQRDALAARLSTIDRDTTAQLLKAKNETNRLNACIFAGTCGLRIAATCDPTPSAGPEAAPGASVGAGASATLGADARQAYSALRDGIDTTEAKLTACQRMLGEFGT